LSANIQDKKYYKLASLLSFVSLLGSVIFIGAQEVWPNYWALIPVLSTALLIWLNSDLKVYSYRPIGILGEISYSLYLWHWPVVVFTLGYFKELTPLSATVGVFSAVCLSFVSYKYVETPARSLTLSFKSVFASLFVIGGVLFASVYVYKTNGVPSSARWSSAINQADLEFLNREPRKAECLTTEGVDSSYCIYGKNKKVSLVVFGDSQTHAA
jgi:hypothetical protein